MAISTDIEPCRSRDANIGSVYQCKNVQESSACGPGRRPTSFWPRGDRLMTFHGVEGAYPECQRHTLAPLVQAQQCRAEKPEVNLIRTQKARFYDD